MSRPSRFLRALGPVTGAILMAASMNLTSAIPGIAVAGDCNTQPGRPADVAAVHGTAFIGEFGGSSRGLQQWRIALPLLGLAADQAEIDYPIAPCQTLDFVPGRRYLVSTSDIARPDSWDTVAYRVLGDGEHVRLHTFKTGVDRSAMPNEFRIDTLDEAIELVTQPVAVSTPIDVLAAVLMALGRFLTALP